MEYELYGSTENEMIVFIHGIGASSWMWWQSISYFKENYQLCLVDLPGHGKNAQIPWTNLATISKMIIDQVIGNRKVHLVGLSLGGHVALEIAKLYPNQVKSAFISGITVKPMPFKFFLPLQASLVQRSLKNTDRLARLGQSYGLPPQKINDFVENYQLLTRENYEAIYSEIMQFSLDQSYAPIKLPLLFAAGDQESGNILETLELAPKIIKSAQSIKIPNAQHTWPVQKPNEFNRTLKDWLNKNKN